MNKAVTQILIEKHGIKATVGQKADCPFCHHHSFSIKSDDSLGKCFHPTCGKFLVANQERTGDISPATANATMQPQSGCKISDYAMEKRLPLELLRNIGLADITLAGVPAVKMPYYDANGEEHAVRFRTALYKTENDIRFKWKKGSKPCLYGLWKLEMAKTKKFIILVEGESDSHTLWLHNIPAIGIPGAAAWKEAWAAYFNEIEIIYVVVEPDGGGTAILKWLEQSQIREKVKLVYLSTYKDASGLYLADPDHFIQNWSQFIELAIPFLEYKKDEKNEKAKKAWQECESLAMNPSILDVFISTLHNEMGVVGEIRLAKLIFLTIITRFLAKPSSLSVRGPSSCGKSYTVEKVLSFFPNEAYYALTAMSDRALAYSEEPLSHRFLILYEYAGMQSEMLNYLIRSLLSEGYIRYATVEKTKDGLKPRYIEKKGPTGLIITTTAIHIHPENETRLISIPISDSKEQTQAILLSLANGNSKKVDLAEWHCLHEWLESANHEVDIPFADTLARNIPPIAVRLRRDFAQVLNLIKAHAILYQAQREIKEGKIIATIQDYRIIRELMNDLISDELEAAVSRTVRETVDCVNNLIAQGNSEVTVKEVAASLQLDKSAAQRRIYSAISKGYLQNLEERRGRPARIVLADAMPEDYAILPLPEMLDGCMVALSQEEK